MPILEEPECLCYWPGLASMQQLVGTYNQAPDLFFLHAEYLMLWFCAQVRCEGLVCVQPRMSLKGESRTSFVRFDKRGVVGSEAASKDAIMQTCWPIYRAKHQPQYYFDNLTLRRPCRISDVVEACFLGHTTIESTSSTGKP